MPGKMLRLIAWLAPAVPLMLALTFAAPAPAEAQGFGPPSFGGRFGGDDRRFRRPRDDDGPGGGFKALPRGDRGGASGGSRLNERFGGRGPGGMRGDGPFGRPMDRPGSRATRGEEPRFPRWPRPGRETSSDGPKGPRPGGDNPRRPDSASQDGPYGKIPCRGRNCGKPPQTSDNPPCRGKRCGDGRPPSNDPRPCRGPYCGGTEPASDKPCRGRRCDDTRPPANDDGPGRPCRGRRCDDDRPGHYPPRRPPVIVVTPIPPMIPEPLDEAFEEADEAEPYTPPSRPTPVHEPASPDRPRPPARRVDSPPPPPPPGILTAPQAPVPARRDFALAERPQYRPNELLVTVQGAEPDAVAGQLAQTFNLVIEESQAFVLLENRRVYRFSIPDNRPVETVIPAVANAPGVAQTSPNFYHYLQGESGAASLEMQYALPKLRVPDTQTLVSGRGVTVAVIDSGVDIEHPALQKASITFFDAVEGGVKEPDPHGTAITGIIAGRGEISGIAPGAKILAVRTFAAERLGAPPTTTSMALARATDTAFARGARVFNMSFAGPRDPLLLELIDAGHEKGAVFIAAAGNAGPKAPPTYPAAYEKVIGITATDELDALYTMANRGAYVSIAAPGVDILAPVTGKALDYMSGTSFAAAHITGVVALLMERNPQLKPDEIRDILAKAARDLGAAGQDEDFGAGLADAYAALVMASPKLQSSISP